jgi:hypothetical protein
MHRYEVQSAREAPFIALEWSVAITDVRECSARVEGLCAGTE